MYSPEKCVAALSIKFSASAKKSSKAGLLLELRQHKNDTIQSKEIPILKLARFFPRSMGDEKERQFQNQNFFRLNEVILILSWL